MSGADAPHSRVIPGSPDEPGGVALIGSEAIGLFQTARELYSIFVRTLYYTFRGRREPGVVAEQMYEIGNRSLFFLTVVMGFFGTILVYQAGLQNKRVLPDLTMLGATYLELLVRDLAASIGALIGSIISYVIGWRYGTVILSLWPLRDHPDFVEKGNAAFRRWGAFAVTIGHFFGPLRAVVFVMAGISRMSVPVFMAVNFVGCLAWAYVTPMFGEVAARRKHAVERGIELAAHVGDDVDNR